MRWWYEWRCIIWMRRHRTRRAWSTVAGMVRCHRPRQTRRTRCRPEFLHAAFLAIGVCFLRTRDRTGSIGMSDRFRLSSYAATSESRTRASAHVARTRGVTATHTIRSPSEAYACTRQFVNRAWSCHGGRAKRSPAPPTIAPDTRESPHGDAVATTGATPDHMELECPRHHPRSPCCSRVNDRLKVLTE